MKKTALTFGLFSLVMVATSFANPTNDSSKEADTIGDVMTGSYQGRKVDFKGNTNDLNNQTEGFRQDRQSVGNSIKLD